MKNPTFAVLVVLTAILGFAAANRAKTTIAARTLASAPSFRPLIVGDPVARRISLTGDSLPDTTGGWRAYVFDPLCTACQELARLARSAGHDSTTFWLSVSDPARTEDFRERYAVPQSLVIYLNEDLPATGDRLAAAGIHAVPAALVVNAGVVRRLAVQLEPDTSASSAIETCS